MKIHDRMINITDRDFMKSIEMVDIEKLDQMLTENNVEHTFFYATEEMQNKCEEKGDREYIVTLLYSEEDEITVSLIVLLWNKTTRNAPDEKIIEAFRRQSKKYAEVA